jgi:hypothetical protein
MSSNPTRKRRKLKLRRHRKAAWRRNGKYAWPSGVPPNPDALITREQAAKALTAAGFPYAKTTLDTKASRRGGPPYQLYGKRSLYRWGDALAWAQSRLSTPRCSTSEGDAIDQAARAMPYPAAALSDPPIPDRLPRAPPPSTAQPTPAPDSATRRRKRADQNQEAGAP